MNVGPAVSSRLALQRSFARTDFLTSKTSISRRSRPGSAARFKGSRPDRLVFILSTLSTSQAAKRGAHGNDISDSRMPREAARLVPADVEVGVTTTCIGLTT